MLPRRPSALLLALASLAVTGGLTLAGTGVEGREEQTPAAVAVRRLVSGTPEDALAAVPEDFAALRGYRPVIEDGQLVRADGDCSSPVPLPEEFEPVCRQHDYGYDLLRYADQTGEPLGRWARGAIDDRMAQQLRGLCAEAPSGDVCRRMAVVTQTGIELNSRRQGDGVPEESLLTNAALATSVAALLGMGVAIPRSRRPA